MASEAISEYLISKHFLGKHASRPPYSFMLMHVYIHSGHPWTPLLKILAMGLGGFPLYTALQMRQCARNTIYHYLWKYTKKYCSISSLDCQHLFQPSKDIAHCVYKEKWKWLRMKPILWLNVSRIYIEERNLLFDSIVAHHPLLPRLMWNNSWY